MKGEIFYSIANFACSATVLVCAGWLLTDQTLRRVVRAGHAMIAAGMLVNILGLIADYLHYKGIEYGHVWPGEVIGNAGVAVLMLTWLLHARQKKRL
jgi:hypothetical protein